MSPPIDMSDEDASKFDAQHAAIEELRRVDGGAELIEYVERAARHAGRIALEFGESMAPLALEAGKALLISLAQSAIEDAMKGRK